MDKVTFLQFIELTEEAVLDLKQKFLTEADKKKKKIPKPKPRPKKTLWFDDANLWNADLQFAHGGKFEHRSSEEEEESKRHVFAVDPKTNACYGVWQGSRNRGVTFHTPRPLHILKSPRMRIRQMS